MQALGFAGLRVESAMFRCDTWSQLASIALNPPEKVRFIKLASEMMPALGGTMSEKTQPVDSGEAALQKITFRLTSTTLDAIELFAFEGRRKNRYRFTKQAIVEHALALMLANHSDELELAILEDLSSGS